MTNKAITCASIMLLFIATGCSAPGDVEKSPTLASFTSSGDIASATYCVRKKKEATGTLVNSVMSFDLFPTPSGTEMHLYAQGDHRITYAIAYYTENSNGYSVEVKATGPQWGQALVDWVGSCAASR